MSSILRCVFRQVSTSGATLAFKSLPTELTDAPVFAQSPEFFAQTCPDGWYRIADVEKYIAESNGWLPEEWRWYSAQSHTLQASCCGILGGNHTNFLRYYADLAIRMVEHPKNQRAWACWPRLELGNMLVEQYLLNACSAFCAQMTPHRFGDVSIAYLFERSDSPFDADKAREKGYTHLLGSAKRDPSIVKMLEQRVRADFPHKYERCQRVAREDKMGACGLR